MSVVFPEMCQAWKVYLPIPSTLSNSPRVTFDAARLWTDSFPTPPRDRVSLCSRVHPGDLPASAAPRTWLNCCFKRHKFTSGTKVAMPHWEGRQLGTTGELEPRKRWVSLTPGKRQGRDRDFMGGGNGAFKTICFLLKEELFPQKLHFKIATLIPSNYNSAYLLTLGSVLLRLPTLPVSRQSTPNKGEAAALFSRIYIRT